MKLSVPFVLALLTLCSCESQESVGDVFTVETMSPITPVKDQGPGPVCWIYAMLATIETDRLALGDSVNLSAAYVARHVLRDEAERLYMRQGADTVSLAGVATDLIDVIGRHGLVGYDAYRPDRSLSVAERRVDALSRAAVRSRSGLESLLGKVDAVLDETIGPAPSRVYLHGAEYSPTQFARSVCMPDDYEALVSLAGKPFYEMVTLDIPDNRRGRQFLNVPIDTLMSCVERALEAGRGVCWEGDVTEPGFSFERGVARLDDEGLETTQALRQKALEDFTTTDDHCMELVGLARDAAGGRYLICKNSWGTGNPYGGLMYMSMAYARMKTVAVVMKKE